jgi:mono/diheme cytochrome c family protein
MARAALIVLSLLSLPPGAFAQPANPSLVVDMERLGLRLFTQSCAICHTRPQLIGGVFGPVLSRESAGGREDVMRDVISNGTPRMPGFKYHFTPTEIAAIVAYLKTVPPEPPPAPR